MQGWESYVNAQHNPDSDEAAHVELEQIPNQCLSICVGLEDSKMFYR